MCQWKEWKLRFGHAANWPTIAQMHLKVINGNRFFVVENWMVLYYVMSMCQAQAFSLSPSVGLRPLFMSIHAENYEFEITLWASFFAYSIWVNIFKKS